MGRGSGRNRSESGSAQLRLMPAIRGLVPVHRLGLDGTAPVHCLTIPPALTREIILSANTAPSFSPV